MGEAGDFSSIALRIAGFVVAAFVMYALVESRFDRAKTLALFGGGMTLTALANAAGFAVFGFEAFAPFYPLTANVPGLVLLFAVSRQRPLVNVFTLLTAVQVNAIAVAAGAGVSWLVAGSTGSVAADLAGRAAVAVPLVAALFRWFRSFYLDAARTMQRGWGLLCLMPLAFYAQFYLLELARADLGEAAVRTAVVVLALVLMAAAYGVVFIVFYKHIMGLRSDEQQRLLAMQVHAFEREVEAVRRADKATRILRHDLRHHMAEAAALVQNGNTADALAVIGGIEGEIEAATPQRFCKNETVNALLSLYLGRAEAAGIQVEASCDVPPEPPVPSLELAGLLANAVENAERACAALPPGAERRIEVRCVCSPSLALEVANTYAGEVTFDAQGRPVAREPGHGAGTASVAAFARKHNAAVFYEADGSVFHLRLLGPSGEPGS